ncbi:hypothetical protein PVW47_01575 [Marinovum sp. SP66]|uniref:hypothetical protein n=1 Tax=Marinovum TaxID=367771 RepID=UPI00237B2322|nr:hypothetical protein [Marinovum sp. SP66]MDD9738463.1 hypothetical protein [Marinovum sp. SP66]
MTRPASQIAGILCNDPAFRAFVDTQTGAPCPDADAAATFLRRQCGVTSRRQLDTDPEARDRFDRLRTDFDAHTGRIAQPR